MRTRLLFMLALLLFAGSLASATHASFSYHYVSAGVGQPSVYYRATYNTQLDHAPYSQSHYYSYYPSINRYSYYPSTSRYSYYLNQPAVYYPSQAYYPTGYYRDYQPRTFTSPPAFNSNSYSSRIRGYDARTGTYPGGRGYIPDY